MQLRKMMVMLAAVGAVGLMLNGCGDDPATSDSCTADADCGEGGFCNTSAGVCMDTCESASDCPDTAKNCAVLAGSTSTQKVCQCQTDQLCNGGGEGDLVCSDLDKVCVTACTTNDDCGTGRTCDTATGQCEAGSGPGTTCSGEGLSTCSYGQICASSTCSAPPTPTCENYQNFDNKADLGTTGPILYKAVTTSAATDTTFCGTTNTKRVKITLSAYTNAQNPFPTRSQDLNSLFYVLVDGSPTDPVISSTSGNYTVNADRTQATIVVNLCREPSSTTTSTGFYFKGGNFLCFQSTY